MTALRSMSDWLSTACTPNPYSSRINVICIKGVWQSLYAVDVHMDVSPPRYGCSCRPTFWNFVRNLVYSQAIKCGGWDCKPNPYSSHINVIYIKGVWQPLYAVDVHMDVSPPRYICSCRPSFWNFARNMGYSQAISNGKMRWSML